MRAGSARAFPIVGAGLAGHNGWTMMQMEDETMALIDDDRPQKRPTHELGQDVSALSIADLDLRIGWLEDEIRRLREAKDAKIRSRDAAASFFRT